MSFITVAKDGAVGTLTFNRPEMRNAFLAEMYEDCCTALRDFAADDHIRAVVLQGEGADFCTGNDLNEFLSVKDSMTPERMLDRTLTPSTDMVHVVAEFPKPLIAAVTGRAIGWGATMLLHCDAVVADPTAVMIFKFVAMGIIPEGGATRLLKERIGVARASHILLSGGAVAAEQAFSQGLFTELVGEGDAEARALELAQGIAVHPPQAVTATKQLIRRADTTLSEHIDAEFEAFARRMIAPDSQALFKQLLKR